MHAPQQPSSIPQDIGAATRPAAERRRWWTWPQLWLFGMLSLAYAPMFWGQIIFFRDPAHWNFPARAFVRRALLNGEFPHWNPFTGLGLPVWGNPLYGVFYPPNWLLLVVPDTLVANALSWQSFGHMFWGGCGLIVLARQFGCGRTATLVAGLAWSLGGYTTSMWSAGLLLIAGAWLPWVAVGMIAALRSAIAGQRGQAVVKAGVPLAFALLTGEPFIAFMSMGFGLLTALVWQVQQRGEGTQTKGVRVRLSLTLAAGWACAVLVSAIVIVPARAVLSQSPRAHGVGKLEAERYSFHPLRLIELVAPESFGLPVVEYPGAKYVGEAAIDGLPLAFSAYFGACAFALALLALRKGHKAPLLLTLFWLFVLLLAFGRHTPVHSVWRSVALPFAYMRYPEKYVVMMVAWGSLLAGLGAQRLLHSNEPVPWKRPATLLALMALTLFVSGSFVEFEVARYMRAGCFRGGIMLVVLLALLWFRRKRAPWLAPALIALLFVDFAPTVWNLQPFAPGHMVLGRPAMANVILDAAEQAVPRLYRSNKVPDTIPSFLSQDSMSALESRRLQTLMPNFGSSFGIATVPGYDAATSSHFDAFWAEGLQFGSTTMRLLSVDFALLPVSDPNKPEPRPSDQYTPVMDPMPGSRLYKIQNSLPRVYVAGAAAVLNDDKTLFHLFTPQVADGGLVLVAGGQGVEPIQRPPQRVGECQLKPGSWSRLEAVCDVRENGVAVFVEQFDPAWRVTVDGVGQKLLRVNHALRGVKVGPGHHTIQMWYQPKGVRVALALCCIGLAGFLIAGASWRRRPRQRDLAVQK